MPDRTVVIAGRDRERSAELLRTLLPETECALYVTPGESPEFRNVPCDMALLLPLVSGSDRTLRRSLRALTHRQGLVVAYGRDAGIRIACKGFAYRFRWFDEGSAWPGLASADPAVIGAARIAHELGVDASAIKGMLG